MGSSFMREVCLQIVFTCYLSFTAVLDYALRYIGDLFVACFAIAPAFHTFATDAIKPRRLTSPKLSGASRGKREIDGKRS